MAPEMRDPSIWKEYYPTDPNLLEQHPDCVDGRPYNEPELVPQMLGGSIHPALLLLLHEEKELTLENFRYAFQRLVELGYPLGFHRGSHKNPEENKSDCGFADNLPKILNTLVNQRDEIEERIVKVLQQNNIDITVETVKQVLDALVSKINMVGDPKISGDRLIKAIEEDPELSNHTYVYELVGDHKEEAALVNLVEGTTFDTNRAAQEGHQAFNLDLWLVEEIAKQLGIELNFAVISSLALYVATEIVLVENKGKPSLPIIVNLQRPEEA